LAPCHSAAAPISILADGSGTLTDDTRTGKRSYSLTLNFPTQGFCCADRWTRNSQRFDSETKPGGVYNQAIRKRLRLDVFGAAGRESRIHHWPHSTTDATAHNTGCVTPMKPCTDSGQQLCPAEALYQFDHTFAPSGVVLHQPLPGKFALLRRGCNSLLKLVGTESPRGVSRGAFAPAKYCISDALAGTEALAFLLDRAVGTAGGPGKRQADSRGWNWATLPNFSR